MVSSIKRRSETASSNKAEELETLRSSLDTHPSLDPDALALPRSSLVTRHSSPSPQPLLDLRWSLVTRHSSPSPQPLLDPGSSLVTRHSSPSPQQVLDPGSSLVTRHSSPSPQPVLDPRSSLVTRHSSLTPDYWRSLEELAGAQEVQEFLAREFPDRASEWLDPVGRRAFLKLMGASLALAGLNSCTRQPAEKVLPYVRQPEEIVPGRPLYFATTFLLGGVATGILVESHEGRPTKIEGNPDHPASLGAADVFAQASILGLYDPDRSQTVTHLGDISTWSGFLGNLSAALQNEQGQQGAGIRLLTQHITSPTLGAQIQTILDQYPAAKWHQYEPVGRDNARAGAQIAFGDDVNTVYRLEEAEVVLALDADFFSIGPGSLRYAREFARKRRLDNQKNSMNRLYVVESTPSITGAKADHRLPLPPQEIEHLARSVAARLGIIEDQGSTAGEVPSKTSMPDAQSSNLSRWIDALENDLRKHQGASVIIPGEYQPPIVHALAHAINHALGNVGKTVFYTNPIEADPGDRLQSLAELVHNMKAGQVNLLLILGGNPVYDVPADLGFPEALSEVGFRVHLGLYNDETSELCHWHIPEAHYLESWSDSCAYDGTVSMVQPLIAPLYGGKTAHELVSALMGQPEGSSYDIVRQYWQKRSSSDAAGLPNAGKLPDTATGRGGDEETGRRGDTAAENVVAKAAHPPVDFEQFWRRAVHDGFIASSALSPKSVTLRKFEIDSGSRVSAPGSSAETEGLEILFRPDPSVFDGRFSNNGWLQELPKPLTKLVWDNAALISPNTARRLGLTYQIGSRGGEHGEVFADTVELRYRGRTVRTPVWIVPGQADNCVTVHLGYGRTRAGRVGTGAGFNAYSIRTSDAPWSGSGLELHKTNERSAIVTTQLHHNVEGRDLVRSVLFEEYRNHEGPSKAQTAEANRAPSLYPQREYKDHAWGMSIDLNSCIGCNACVIACQSENNIPVVGKSQVGAGREMHWIRVDRYYKGDMQDPETLFQPVPCMQCENAPCELVCPVAATVHSAEGLNDMVYNRCVGTRYCSNNCPYKVRRFNFLLYQDWDTTTLKMMRNPDVTVRSRGVMEKCTYCVQRINHAKIGAENENRKLRDGEILTACQQACPAEAIIFGDINDPNSRVAREKAERRSYALLGELNTRPRTTYLAAARNPNPELMQQG